MKNLLKFFAFVALLSLAISALYDYRLRHGGLSTLQRTTPEKYTLASSPNVDPKQVASLDALNRERRALVSSVLPSVADEKGAPGRSGRATGSCRSQDRRSRRQTA